MLPGCEEAGLDSEAGLNSEAGFVLAEAGGGAGVGAALAGAGEGDGAREPPLGVRTLAFALAAAVLGGAEVVMGVWGGSEAAASHCGCARST